MIRIDCIQSIGHHSLIGVTHNTAASLISVMADGTRPVRNTKKPDPPRPPPPDLLAGRVIHFVPEDFDELIILLLEELAAVSLPL